MRLLNLGGFPLQTFIIVETLQFNSVADILSLGVFNIKKWQGFRMKMSSVKAGSEINFLIRAPTGDQV